jgi:hypothetical protein
MKTQKLILIVMTVFLICGLAADSKSAFADYSSSNNQGRSSRRDASGFWSQSASSSSHAPTTPEISQGLYGTDPSQYDTSESNDTPEVINQAG